MTPSRLRIIARLTTGACRRHQVGTGSLVPASRRGVVMIEVPLAEVPTEVLERFSRDSELNAQFLHGRAAELIADAEWFERNSPDPTRAHYARSPTASMNVPT